MTTSIIRDSSGNNIVSGQFCLYGALKNRSSINCDGATNQVGFFYTVGFWKIEVNGFLYGSDNLTMIELLNEFIPNHEYLKTVLDGGFIEDYMLRNKSSEFLRIRFIGSVNFDGGQPDIRDVTDSYDWFLNPTWFAENMQTPTGKVSFCLAPYEPPIEEPIWDIKYLVNGSWIYETTGSIVEQDANRDMYRTTATELVIADSVTEISYYAFRFWSALTSVKLGQSIRVIGSRAFEDCSKLTEFICPDSLESIEDTALGGCTGIRLVEFSSSLNSIGSAAFAACYLLEVAVFKSRNMPILGQYAFGNGSNNSPRPSIVYVPDDLFNEYAVAIWNLADISKFRSLSTYES